MKYLQRIWAYVANYWPLVVVNLLCNALSAVFSLFSVVMVVPLLQLIFNQVPAVSSPPVFSLTANGILETIKFYISAEKNAHGAASALLLVCVTLVLIIFLKNFFRYMALRTLSPIRTGVMKNLRSDLFSKILSQPLSYFSNQRKGDLITRLTDDVRAIENSVVSMLEVSIKEPLNIILSLGWMLSISPKLTLFVFAMLGIIGFVIGRIGKSLKKQSLDIQGTVGQLISTVEETISGLRIVHAFGAESQRNEQFQQANERLYSQGNTVNRRYELASPLTEFLAIGVFSTALWFGGNMVLGGEIEAATFFGFVALFSMLIQPAKSFSAAFSNIRIGLASAQRVFEVIDAENNILEKTTARVITSFQEKISWQQVSFAYGNATPVLHNISLDVAKGKTIALVGPSGAGKSTLVDLLLRFHDVCSGKILIDQADLRDLKIASLRALFGMVSQEPILFNGSVAENIALGKPASTREEIMAAARAAHAHDFISKLPKGYDSPVGERGGKLSGGERQRITIARALLKNPPILILDEATSSLDAESESLVQAALVELMQGRTTIVIAHRLATIQKADEIIVLQAGQIAERGTHASLMTQNGLYKKMVDLQNFT